MTSTGSWNYVYIVGSPGSSHCQDMVGREEGHVRFSVHLFMEGHWRSLCNDTGPNLFVLDFNIPEGSYIGAVTSSKTSSITSSGPTSARTDSTASSLLPHCILLSLSGGVMLIRCRYTFLTASPTRAGVI